MLIISFSLLRRISAHVTTATKAHIPLAATARNNASGNVNTFMRPSGNLPFQFVRPEIPPFGCIFSFPDSMEFDSKENATVVIRRRSYLPERTF